MLNNQNLQVKFIIELKKVNAIKFQILFYVIYSDAYTLNSNLNHTRE